MTEPGGGREPIDRLVDEFLERRQRGESVSIDDYVATYPELEEEIRALFPVVEFVEEAVRPSRAGRSDTRSDTTGLTAETVARLARRGDAFGRYSIEGEVARGGQGAVLCVWDEDLQRRLAMKVVLPRTGLAREAPVADSRSVGRFLEEAQVTGQLDHPGIVPVHELGLDADGQVYFTMKLVKGRDLKTIFDLVRAGEEGWTQTRALHVMLKVCEAMAYAHAKGVIHRDLKPGNVMVGKFGEVYVMDWGLAKVVGREDVKDVRIRPELTTEEVRSDQRKAAADPDSPLFTMDGDVVGTPAYMSPEQALGDLERMGPHSDVYAAGAMLYQLVSGQMPYVPTGSRLDNYAIWYQVQKGPPDPLPEIAPETPGELVAICEKAMARDPGARYANMMELAEELRAYLEHRVVGAYRTGALVELKKWVERNKALAAALAAAVLALVAGLGVALVLLGELRDGLEKTQALALAGAASEARRSDPSLGLLLAREAVRKRESPETVTQLQAALSASHERFVFRGHEGPVWCIALSPDEDAVLTGSADGSARLWDLEGNELLKLDGHEGDVMNAAFSPDGGRILTGEGWGHRGMGSAARLWDRATGELLAVLQHEGPLSRKIDLPAGNRRGRLAVFSGDGKWILTGSADGTARLWDEEGHLVQSLPHESQVTSVSFSPDDRRILTAERNGVLSLWSLNGQELSRRRIHDGWVLSARFSPDGRSVVASGPDGTARVLRVDPRGAWMSEIVVLPEAGQVCPPTFSPDGGSILTASQNLVRLWRADGELLHVFPPHTGLVRGASFSADGQFVLTHSHHGSVRLLRVGGQVVDEFRGHRSGVGAGLVSRGGLVLTASDDWTARFWAVSSPELPVLNHASSVSRGIFSPSGDLILTVSSSARLWSRRGELLGEFEVGPDAGWAAAFTPDGQRILTERQYENSLTSWTRSGELVDRLPVRTEVRWFSISPDGGTVVTAEGSFVRIWALGHDDWRLRREIRLDDYPLRTAFSPRGDRFATGSGNGVVRLFDLAGDEELAFTVKGSCLGLAFSPDGESLLTGSAGGNLQLWALEGALQMDFLGHQGAVRSVVFSPDGTLVASASNDRTARMWTLDGKEVMQLQGELFRSIAFSPDGELLLTTSADGTARSWPVLARDPPAASRPATLPFRTHLLGRGEKLASKNCWGVKVAG